MLALKLSLYNDWVAQTSSVKRVIWFIIIGQGREGYFNLIIIESRVVNFNLIQVRRILFNSAYKEA